MISTGAALQPSISKRRNCPASFPEVVEIRDYPSGSAFAHILGYVQPAPESVAGDDPLLRHPGFRIGRTGAEAAREDTLRGERGSLKVEVNAYGRVIRELPDQSVPATPGEDVRLTIDAEVQRFAHERLAGESAAAVAMDVENGDLLALVSTPGFDPNQFVTGISQTDFNALNQNEFRPLYNKALQGTYPPASTFKAVVALAALEAGVVRPDERFTCRGSIPISAIVNFTAGAAKVMAASICAMRSRRPAMSISTRLPNVLGSTGLPR